MPNSPNLGIVHVDPAQANKTATINEELDALDVAIAGMLSKDISGSTATITLATSPDGGEAENAILEFHGARTADVSIVLPKINRIWHIVDDCTGGHSLTVKCSTGTGVSFNDGDERNVRWDGTNVVAASGLLSAGSGSGLTVETEVDNGTVTTNTTISFSGSSFHKITTATDALQYTLSTTGVVKGQVIEVRSYITGALTTGPTWATSSGSIKWAGGSAPVSSIVSGYVDTIRLKWDGTNWIEQSRAMGAH